MTLFNNTFSTIITWGLGAPACCTLLTANFGLACGCTIVVVPGGGGGGQLTVPEFYTPMTPRWTKTTALVIVTVKIRDNVYRRQYVVDRDKAAILISISNFIDRMKEKAQIGIGKITNATRRVAVKLLNKD